jgi:hypothetical protein
MLTARLTVLALTSSNRLWTIKTVRMHRVR